MNVDELAPRLSMFNPQTTVLVLVPMADGSSKQLPIVGIGHHGQPPDLVSDDPAVTLEIFTPPWTATSDPGSTCKIQQLTDRLVKHSGGTRVSVAVPCEVGDHGADRKHHRILHIDMVAVGSAELPGRLGLPIQLIAGGWESIDYTLRMDE